MNTGTWDQQMERLGRSVWNGEEWVTISVTIEEETKMKNQLKSIIEHENIETLREIYYILEDHLPHIFI